MPRLIHHPHDKLFKKSMENIKIAREFLTTNLSKNLLKNIDLRTLQIENSAFTSDLFKKSEADMIYSAKMKDGRVTYIYLLCEHQSTVDDDMAFRILVYEVAIMQKHMAKYPDSLLPLVFPIVVYSGKKPWNAPTDIFKLFGGNEALAREVLLQPFKLIELNKMDDATLEKQVWSGVFQYVLKKQQASELESNWAQLFPWLDLHDKEGLHHAVKAVLYYIIDSVERGDMALFEEKAKEHFSPELRGEAMTLAEQYQNKGLKDGMQRGIKQGMEQGIEQGIERGVKKGREEGWYESNRQIAKNMLVQGMPAAMIAKLIGLAEADVQKIAAEEVH